MKTKRLLLDVLLTGHSILLEFWAPDALRIREPNMPREFSVPGGLFGAHHYGLTEFIHVQGPIGHSYRMDGLPNE